MDLAQEYRQQSAWRPWARVLDELPPLAGQTVLDLGCGPGEQAALLVARGARVVGLDANEELLCAARARALQGARFERADLRAPIDPGVVADGLWCSFAPAYFPDLAPALAAWTRSVVPGGWVALVEVDDLFGHEPLCARARELLDATAARALAAGLHDFRMGGKLAEHARRSGLADVRTLALEDAELAFDGPAAPDVLAAWTRRLERMRLPREVCGAEWGAERDELLATLARADHRSRARVVLCLARTPR